MRSTLSVEVQAPADLVFRLAREVERWPALLPHYLRVRILERRDDGSVVAQMLAVRRVVPVIGLGVPVVWRARTWAEPAMRRLRFVHRGGATDGMDVTWRIEPIPGGCRVSIDHVFDPHLPAPLGRGWAMFIDRSFVRPIASRTLTTFKAIAEAAADDWSDPASPTNPSP